MKGIATLESRLGSISENAWATAEMRNLWLTIKQIRWSRLIVSATFVLEDVVCFEPMPKSENWLLFRSE
jgi:hypothetical protein